MLVFKQLLTLFRTCCSTVNIFSAATNRTELTFTRQAIHSINQSSLMRCLWLKVIFFILLQVQTSPERRPVHFEANSPMDLTGRDKSADVTGSRLMPGTSVDRTSTVNNSTRQLSRDRNTAAKHPPLTDVHICSHAQPRYPRLPIFGSKLNFLKIF